MTTVMFTDMEDSTGLARALGIVGIAMYLNQNLALIRDVIEGNRGTVLCSTGDGVFAFWDTAFPHYASSARLALLAAAELSGQIAEENAHRRSAGLPTRRVRIGLNSGEVAVERPRDECEPPRLYGATIHEARRIEQAGKNFQNLGEEAIIMAAPATLKLAGIDIGQICNGAESAASLAAPHPALGADAQEFAATPACAAIPLHPRDVLATLLGCPSN
ncbi:adenylate/guanylate cyclase domain-containing protein [Pelagibius marinus]|uniref:adenylate/guanylate cyclase domain-containing protein n=1 Tax=Pelagibius marinus TaxID=2762760 RepID=UPI001872C472|nr:adenylate/guanylate cyclase domain-containing protein [Pelagibius marinus]